MNELIIRSTELCDLPKISHFPPIDWNFDISTYFKLHFNRPYFIAFTGLIDDKPVAIGSLLFNNQTAWLGTIIVDEAYRNRGFARQITTTLMTFANKNNLKKLALFGTAMGEPLYRSLGFKTSTYFQFVDIENRKTAKTMPELSHIVELKNGDIDKLVALDTMVTNESRKPFLENYLEGAIGYFNDNNLIGYYLPALGDGPILALDDVAGIELLKYKIHFSNQLIMLPENNYPAINYLRKINAEFGIRVPKMYLNEENIVDYNLNFGRGAGYCG